MQQQTADPTAEFERAKACFAEGRYAESEAAFLRLADATPAPADALYGAALSRLQTGDAAGATQMFERVLAVDPAHVHALGQLARLQEAAGVLTGAELLYRRLLELRPEHADARDGLARIATRRAAPPPPPRAAGPGARPVDEATPYDVPRGPAPRLTLASELDELGGDGQPAPMAGEVLHRGHRRLLSHRRFWTGLLALLGLPGLAAAKSSAASLAATNPQLDPAAVTAAIDAAALGLVAVAALLVLAAVVNAFCTTYVVRERRIEITRGVLFRSYRPVWLYDVNDLLYSQSPVQLLSRTAKITLTVDEAPGRKRPPEIVGLGSARFMKDLVEQLQPMVLRERRAMKKQFL